MSRTGSTATARAMPIGYFAISYLSREAMSRRILGRYMVLVVDVIYTRASTVRTELLDGQLGSLSRWMYAAPSREIPTTLASQVSSVLMDSIPILASVPEAPRATQSPASGKPMIERRNPSRRVQGGRKLC